MSTEVMDPGVELNFCGVSGNWTIPGKTKIVYCFTFSHRPQKGSVTSSPSMSLALCSLPQHRTLRLVLNQG